MCTFYEASFWCFTGFIFLRIGVSDGDIRENGWELPSTALPFFAQLGYRATFRA